MSIRGARSSPRRVERVGGSGAFLRARGREKGDAPLDELLERLRIQHARLRLALRARRRDRLLRLGHDGVGARRDLRLTVQRSDRQLPGGAV
eukprot:30969-Pelagococcus_subviridis.AAC.6